MIVREAKCESLNKETRKKLVAGQCEHIIRGVAVVLIANGLEPEDILQHVIKRVRAERDNAVKRSPIAKPH